MKNILLLSIIIGVFIIFSCKTETKKDKGNFERIENYENGVVEKHKVYANQYEYDLNKNYQYYSYYTDGTLREKATFRNGLLDGNCYYYEQDSSFTIMNPYKNGLLNGISKTHNKFGNIITEILYIDDVKVRWKMFTVFENKNRIGYQIFVIDSTNLGSQIGYYYVDDNYEVIKSIGNYYNVNSSSDTIKHGEKYEIEIEILIAGGDTTYGEILIGKINNQEEFIDTSSIVKLEFGNDKKVSFSTKAYDKGDNLILGKIYVYQDTLINNIEYFHESEFLLFHDFYVKD